MHEIQRLFSDPASTLFQEVFPGRRPRPEQVGFAVEIARNIEADGITLIQGETGIGKAIGYALPATMSALRTGRQAMFSTHSIALQNQLLEDTMPAVAKVCKIELGRRPTFVRRVGKRNFISVEAMSRRIEALRSELKPEMLELLEAMLEAVAADLERGTVQMLEHRFGDWVESIGDLPFSFDQVAIGQYKDDDIGYRRMVEASLRADVVIINHALLVTDLLNFGRILTPGNEGGRDRILVVDEADSLPDIAESMQFRRLPFAHLELLEKALKAEGNTMTKPFRAERVRLEKAVEVMGEKYQDSRRVAGQKAAEILPITGLMQEADLGDVVGSLDAIIQTLNRAREGSTRQEAATTVEIESLSSDAKAILEAIRSSSASGAQSTFAGAYWTPVRKFPGLYVSNEQVSDILSRLWSKGMGDIPGRKPDSIAFVSATLSGVVGHDGSVNMREFRHRMGLNSKFAPVVRQHHFAPADFGRMSFTVIKQNAAPPVSIKTQDPLSEMDAVTNPEIFPWWVAMVQAASAEGGRVLVLTTSYSDANTLARMLAEKGTEVILDRPRDRLPLQKFAETENSILITPSKWSGIDLPGKIRHQVFTRLPFSPPDTVRNAHLESLLDELSKKNVFRSRFPILLAKCRRKMGQGLGRGIRQETDEVMIWIGDPRWPVPLDRQDIIRVSQPQWSRSFEDAVSMRFRPMLSTARVFTIENGAEDFVRPRSRLLRSRR